MVKIWTVLLLIQLTFFNSGMVQAQAAEIAKGGLTGFLEFILILSLILLIITIILLLIWGCWLFRKFTRHEISDYSGYYKKSSKSFFSHFFNSSKRCTKANCLSCLCCPFKKCRKNENDRETIDVQQQEVITTEVQSSNTKNETFSKMSTLVSTLKPKNKRQMVIDEEGIVMSNVTENESAPPPTIEEIDESEKNRKFEEKEAERLRKAEEKLKRAQEKEREREEKYKLKESGKIEKRENAERLKKEREAIEQARKEREKFEKLAKESEKERLTLERIKKSREDDEIARKAKELLENEKRAKEELLKALKMKEETIKNKEKLTCDLAVKEAEVLENATRKKEAFARAVRQKELLEKALSEKLQGKDFSLEEVLSVENQELESGPLGEFSASDSRFGQSLNATIRSTSSKSGLIGENSFIIRKEIITTVEYDENRENLSEEEEEPKVNIVDERVYVKKGDGAYIPMRPELSISEIKHILEKAPSDVKV